MLLKARIMGDVNEKQKKALYTIHRNIEKLELQVNDILDVYKLDIGKLNLSKSPINITELINQTVADLKSFSDDKEVRIITEFAHTQNAYGDPRRVGQVISNLIKNSLDFVPRHSGRIVVKTENFDNVKNKNDLNESHGFSTQDKILFTVEDNGIGIPSDRIDNVFKKFYQIDTSYSRKHGGTGLGLAICKGIIEAHGGLIWIDKSSSQGTVVKFTVPTNGVENNKQ